MLDAWMVLDWRDGLLQPKAGGKAGGRRYMRELATESRTVCLESLE